MSWRAVLLLSVQLGCRTCRDSLHSSALESSTEIHSAKGIPCVNICISIQWAAGEFFWFWWSTNALTGSGSAGIFHKFTKISVAAVAASAESGHTAKEWHYMTWKLIYSVWNLSFNSARNVKTTEAGISVRQGRTPKPVLLCEKYAICASFVDGNSDHSIR
jgi:hypothetical protein